MRNVKLKNETQSEKFLWELYRENTIDESVGYSKIGIEHNYECRRRNCVLM